MSKKLSQKIEEKKQDVEKEITTSVALHNLTTSTTKQLVRLGMVAGVGRVAQTLNAHTIRALQGIREEKDFEALGFSRFDDFLNESELAPMTYRQFNEREKLLKQEGDEIFDMLNHLRFSHRQRKLLGSGNVELEGDLVIVTSKNEFGDEIQEEIQINDRDRLLQTLSALADQNSRLNLKTDKQKSQIEKQDLEIEDLSERIQKGTGGKKSVHFELFVRAKIALSQLSEHLEKVDSVEKERNGEAYLRDLYAQFSLCRQAYGRNDLRFDEALDISSEFEEITSSLNDDDLAKLME